MFKGILSMRMVVAGIAVAMLLGLTCLPQALAHQLPKGFSGFEDPAVCGGCHEAIYKEWQGSMHSKSSKAADPVHAAVHEAFTKAMAASGKPQSYFCATCHAPTADNMAALMKGEAVYDPANPTDARGVTCSFCHKADGLVEGDKFNTYKLSEGIKGPSKDSTAPHGSVFSEFNASFHMCLGCHGRMVNGKGGVVCSMDEEGMSDCLKCHMDEALGAPAAGSRKPTHVSHGMPGGHDIAMLKKGATVSLKKELGRLVVALENKNPHMFPSTNPLRVAFVKVELFDKDGKRLFANFDKDPSEDPKAMLIKVFKAGDKTGVPSWEAEGVAKDSRLMPGEERVLIYNIPEGAARASAKLYYRFVPGAAIEKFGIKPDGVVDKPCVVSEAELALK